MIVTYDGGTSQQRQWFEEALAHQRYDLDALDVNVTVSWPVEPSLPGHREFASTSTADGVNFALEIRRAFDSSTDPDFSGRTFYEETVVHELAHIITFFWTTEADREGMCPWFTKYESGEGNVAGTAADLNPTDAPWEDRIQEAMAEIVKDAILPSTYREYDNRTNWRIDTAQYEEFMTALLPPAESGSEHIFSSSTLTAHVPPEYPADGNTFSVGWESQLPGGQTYTLRFRWGRGDGDLGWTGHRDYTITVPDGLVLEGHSEPLFPDTGGGETVAIHTSYIIWDNVDIATVVETPLETIPLEDPDAVGYWRQWAILVPASGGDVPPWPYTDPYVAAGGGDSMVFRTL